MVLLPKEGIMIIIIIMMMMISNHLEALDEASARPRRVDKKMYFTNAGKSELLSIFLITYTSDLSEEIYKISACHDDGIVSHIVSEAKRARRLMYPD